MSPLSLVNGVTFRSQLTPDFSYDPNAPTEPSPPGGAGDLLMQLVRPQVVVDTAAGPMVFSPYGEPSASYGLLALLAIGALVVGGVVMVGWVARKTA